MHKSIVGKVVYQNLGTGFWGVIDDKGNEWLPINMPEQIKQEGAKVELKIEPQEGGMSMMMWGTPVKIISFHTLNPN